MKMTKKYLKERSKDILNNTNIGSEISNEHKDFVLKLLDKHPNKKEKIGCGIDYIYVGINSYNSHAFFVKRKDNTSVAFSYIVCIDGKSHKVNVDHAFRTAVKEQIKDFKNSNFKNNKFTCEITKEELSWENVEVDHIYPKTFSNILKDFINSRNLNFKDIELEDYLENVEGAILKDKLLERDFYDYHKENAKLRIIKKEKNRKFGNRANRITNQQEPPK